MKTFNLSFIIFTINLFLFLGNFELIKAQNEPYHGGIGDGSSVSKSPSINFENVNFEGNTYLSVNINLATGQENITENSPFNFKITFNEIVTDFNSSDVVLSGTALPTIATVTGSGTTYNVQVSGTSSNGSVIINIPSGSAHNMYGNPNQVALISDNEVTYTGQDLTVEVTLSDNQNTPTNRETVNFTATFNDEVTDFTNSDISFSGTANPSAVSVSGSGSIYNIAISGMTDNGTVSISIPENIATNPYGKKNSASINTENEIVCDYDEPTVTIDLADGQSNPTYYLPIKFKIAFSEEVVSFTSDNIAFGGSENLSLSINGSGKFYEATVIGAITNETVSISIPAGQTYDIALNTNSASINLANSVTYLGITSIENIENSIIQKVYFANNNLIIDLVDFPDNNSFVQAYSIDGRLILNEKIIDKQNKFPISIFEKVLMIRIFVNSETINKKIITK